MPVAEPIHLVFVHGLFSSARTWRNFRALVADDPDLTDRIVVHAFEYDSPFWRLRPDRRIAGLDEQAALFDTFLKLKVPENQTAFVVTHSQGGLLAQRYLSRKVRLGEALDLSRIGGVLMYSCPHLGSLFKLTLRQWTVSLWNRQVRDLRPLDESLVETHRDVIHRVLGATEQSSSQYPVEMVACAGPSDGVVPPHTAVGMFPADRTETVPGDHGSIIRFSDRSSPAYAVFRREIDRVLSGQAAAESAFTSDRELTVVPDHQRTTALVGRHELISTVLTAPDASVHVLGGAAGNGKSRAALEIAYHARRVGRRVWWVSTPRVASSMKEVAEDLGAPQRDIDQAWQEDKARDLVWRLLNDCGDPWLLVFDDADDPGRLGPYPGDRSTGTGWLRRPETERGKVVVTSQVRDDGQWGSWCEVHKVAGLSAADGASMLENITTGIRCGNREQARALATALGGWPKGLQLAGEYIVSVNREESPSGTVPLDYESYRQTVLNRDGDGDLYEQLSTVFSASLTRLADRGLSAAPPVLRLLACFNKVPIPHLVLLRSNRFRNDALFYDCGPIDWEETLRGLDGIGLLDIHSRPGVTEPDLAAVVSLHPMLHEALRQTPEVRDHCAEYYGLAIRVLSAALAERNPDHPDQWPVWRAVAPHAIEVCRTALREAKRIANKEIIVRALELARLTSRYLIAVGLLGPADELLRPIVSGCASFEFHPNDREILAIRHEWGRIALESNHPERAEAELADVVEQRTRILREDHADTLASRHKHARAILEQRRWSEAEPLLHDIVETERRVRGYDDSDTLVVRHSHARAILYLGRAVEAEALLRRIVKVRRDMGLGTSPESLFVVLSLAQSLVMQERAAEAQQLLSKTIKTAGDRVDSPEFAPLRTMLATIAQG